MVKRWRKNNSDGRVWSVDVCWCVHRWCACFFFLLPPPLLLSPLWWVKKWLRLISPRIGPFNQNTIRLFQKKYVWIVWLLLNNLRRFLNKIYVAYLNYQVSCRFWDTFSHVVEVWPWRFDSLKNNYVLIASDSFWCARKFIINSHAIQAYRKICGWLCGSRYGNLHFFILRKDYLNNYQSSKTVVKYKFLSYIIIMQDEKYVIRRK
jgi:hypothetical protein